MKEKWNYVLYLIWFSYLILSAIHMFGNGFLLSRKTLSDVSECVPIKDFGCDGKIKSNTSASGSCTDEEKIYRILADPGSPLVCGPVRQRVALVLVDALRYDFTEYDDRILQPLPFQNKLPVMQETLDRSPDKARLFRFMADPPTTTLQRVKALVTGSLPTFIDFSSNFAAMELQEDNIIDQVVSGDAKAVLLGDDTWLRLMPGKWLRTHAQYSFHTWDLDTVDNEVDTKIYDELKKDDWDLLVAHYLGVDHAGHRYGPNHPEMARKLNETNNRLRKILDIIPPDVLLYVIGDHGMTESDSQEWTESGGDHGGESKAERTAAFFAYRGNGFGSLASDIMLGREVQQTDLAPTLSAALGRPPPAPALGNILMAVLPPMSISNTIIHLTNGLKQITHYLVRYGEESNQVPLDKLAQLINITRSQMEKAAWVRSADQLNDYIEHVRSTVDNVKLVYREVWVEFDSLSMLRALLLLMVAIFFNWLLMEGLPAEHLPKIFASSFVPSGLGAMGVCAAVCAIFHHFELVGNLTHAVYLSTGLASTAAVATLAVGHWDAISQRWSESRPAAYERFARAALAASAAALLSNSFVIEEGAALSFLALSVLATMALGTRSIKAGALWAAAGAALLGSRAYRGCREEQGACWAGGGGGGGALAAGANAASRGALVGALGSLAGAAAALRRAAGRRGYPAAAAALLAGAHWAAGWGALGSGGRARAAARAAWAALGAAAALVGARPAAPAQALAALVLALYVANALVVGAAYAPAAALAVVTGFIALNVVMQLKGENTKFPLSTRCSSSVACLWALLASYQFYAMGHHATLGHLRWGPAFHAGDPNYLTQYSPLATKAVISLFVGLDMFGMPLLYGAALPLLVVWGRAPHAPRAQLAAVFSLSLKFNLCFAIRLFACAFSATIHCRHLMIWGVFTPKLMFETFACAAAMIGTILGTAVTVWHTPSQHRAS